jgi:hypothetical protein
MLALMSAEDRAVTLTEITWRDLLFLVTSGLQPDRAGVQYPRSEYRAQFRIAPLRYFNRTTRAQSSIIRVDGRRAGYVGLNPLSTNIEYYLVPWARGGVGGRAVVSYLRTRLPFEHDKFAFMLAGNDRSVHVFRSALHQLGLSDPATFRHFEYPGGQGFKVRAGARPMNDPG